MAEVGAHEAYVSFVDHIGRSTSWSIRVSEASAKAYAAAADTAARAATAVGQLLDATKVLSRLNWTELGVRYSFANSPYPGNPAAEEALRGEKAVIQFEGSGRGFTTSIPGRNATNITTVPSDGKLLIDITDGGVATWVGYFEAVALDINGAAVTVTGGYFND